MSGQVGKPQGAAGECQRGSTERVSAGRSETENERKNERRQKHHERFKVKLVLGDYKNIKITTPNDFYMFRAMVDARENSQIFG